MTLYPVFLDLTGQRVLVAGGGRVALRRTLGLLEAGADVTVVAPELLPDFKELTVTVHTRPFQDADLTGARLAFACTDSDAVNAAVVEAARARGVWCANASSGAEGDLRLGATVRKGGVTATVHTGAELPYLSQALRDRLDAALPANLPVDAWAARRSAALELGGAQRELVLDTLRAEIRRAVQP